MRPNESPATDIYIAYMCVCIYISFIYCMCYIFHYSKLETTWIQFLDGSKVSILYCMYFERKIKTIQSVKCCAWASMCVIIYAQRNLIKSNRNKMVNSILFREYFSVRTSLFDVIVSCRCFRNYYPNIHTLINPFLNHSQPNCLNFILRMI